MNRPTLRDLTWAAYAFTLGMAYKQILEAADRAAHAAKPKARR